MSLPSSEELFMELEPRLPSQKWAQVKDLKKDLFTEEYCSTESLVLVRIAKDWEKEERGGGATGSQVNQFAGQGFGGGFGGCSEVLPNLLLGGEDAMGNRSEMQRLGIKLVINMCAEKYQAENPYKRYNAATKRTENIACREEFVAELRRACFTPFTTDDEHTDQPLLMLYVAADDVPSYDISQHLLETSELMEEVFQCRDLMQAFFETGGEGARKYPEAIVRKFPGVAVHCMAGVSRSTTVVAAYLMKKCRASRDDVIKCVRRRREIVRPNNGFLNALLLFEHCGYTRLLNPEAIRGLVRHLVSDSFGQLAFLKTFIRTVLSYAVGSDRKLFGQFVRALLDYPFQQQQEEEEGGGVGGAKGKKSGGGFTTAADIASILSLTMQEYIQNQEYVDTPKIFEWWCELTSGVAWHAPIVMYVAAEQDNSFRAVLPTTATATATAGSTASGAVAGVASSTFIAETNVGGAAWSDAVHHMLLESMIEDKENDLPLIPLFDFIACLCSEYQHKLQLRLGAEKKEGEAAMTASPALIVARKGRQEDCGDDSVKKKHSRTGFNALLPSKVEFSTHSIFQTMRTSFPLSLMLCVASYRNALLNEIAHPNEKAAPSASLHHHSPTYRVIHDSIQELKKLLHFNVVSQDVEVFLLLALLNPFFPDASDASGKTKPAGATATTTAAPVPLAVAKQMATASSVAIVTAEWDNMLASLQQEHEHSPSVIHLTVEAVVKKLVCAIVAATVLVQKAAATEEAEEAEGQGGTDGQGEGAEGEETLSQAHLAVAKKAMKALRRCVYSTAKTFNNKKQQIPTTNSSSPPAGSPPETPHTPLRKFPTLDYLNHQVCYASAYFLKFQGDMFVTGGGGGEGEEKKQSKACERLTAELLLGDEIAEEA